MSATLIAVTLLIMLIGVVGTVAPVLPGVALIWVAGIGSWVLAGFGTAGWVAAIGMTLLAIGGSVAKYVLPGRAGRSKKVPRRSMAAGIAGAVLGFFVIPVVGFVIGGLVGVYAAEVSRTGSSDVATDNTMAMLKSFGLGVLVESAAGVAMILIWVATVIAAAS